MVSWMLLFIVLFTDGQVMSVKLAPFSSQELCYDAAKTFADRAELDKKIERYTFRCVSNEVGT